MILILCCEIGNRKHIHETSCVLKLAVDAITGSSRIQHAYIMVICSPLINNANNKSSHGSCAKT